MLSPEAPCEEERAPVQAMQSAQSVCRPSSMWQNVTCCVCTSFSRVYLFIANPPASGHTLRLARLCATACVPGVSVEEWIHEEHLFRSRGFGYCR